MEDFQMPPEEQQELTRNFLRYLSEIDYHQSPPAISKYIHKEIKKYLNTHDPYFVKKKYYNEYINGKYDFFYNEILKTPNPYRGAVQLAIAGNIIDLGPNQNFDMEGVIHKALDTDITLDKSEELLEKLKNADSILYLTDNTGEIVFDKLLIQYLIEHEKIPRENFIVATRGYPILNDATYQDAEEIGLTEMVKVIDNGDSAPGTILETTSEEFQNIFSQAELIISKGQGNYETLSHLKQRNIYYLLIAKCPLVAESAGVSKGSFICSNICLSASG